MSKIDYKYSHAAILVSDLERSASFYHRAFGWEREFAHDFDESLGVANGFGGPGSIVMGRLGGVHLQLVKMHVPLERKERPPHFGIFMCSVMVTDLTPVLANLKSEGISITRDMQIGRSRLLVVTDPDGQEIGIICPDAKA
jgi:predicted enzyme related to lactoylglutathione lyase